MDENNNVKLSDFGVSFMMERDGDDRISSNAGSYYYYSPEACMGSTFKGRKSDIWACGITLYYMIYKKHPFISTVIPDLFKKIRKNEPEYPETTEVDPLLLDLLKKVLKKNFE